MSRGIVSMRNGLVRAGEISGMFVQRERGGEIMAAAMRIRRCDGVCALWGGEVEVTNKNQLPTSPTSSSTYLPLPSTTNHL